MPNFGTIKNVDAMGIFKNLFSQNNKTNPNLWKGSNLIERTREDGYIIYKSNRVSIDERNFIGFYGLKWFSDNKKFCVVWLNDPNAELNVALIDCISNSILYKIKIDRPAKCIVNDDGFVCCEDWGITEYGSVVVLNKNGAEIKRNIHQWPLQTNLIFKNGEFIYGTNDNVNYNIKID